MRKTANDLERQLATASEAADQYRDALSALAKSETEAVKDMTPEMRRQMEVAKERMKKYQNVYSKLAK